MTYITLKINEIRLLATEFDLNLNEIESAIYEEKTGEIIWYDSNNTGHVLHPGNDWVEENLEI